VASLRRASARGVDVRVVTNSLVASDEPLVTVGYAQYRRDLLLAGVRLFEVASERLKRFAHRQDAGLNGRTAACQDGPDR
jgi:putative cardiolipin synthase